jgi:hypothetical protein
MLEKNVFLRPLFPISLRWKHAVLRGPILAVLGSTDCLTRTAGYAAFKKFAEIPGMTGVGRKSPIRNPASAGLSVFGNGNFWPN